MLQLAKFTEDDIKPLSQTISFTSENLYNNDYIFLQLDSHLEKEVSEGSTLYIKGNDDEEVFLCTKDKTFRVMEAETSNSLLLVEGLKFECDVPDDENRSCHDVEVKGIFHQYLEPVLTTPSFIKLDQLLNNAVYKGPEYEFEVDREKLYTLEELKQCIQASDKEVELALTKLNVVQIDGKIRLIDFEYHFRVLSYMLKLIDENSWELDQIDYDATLEALKDLAPREIICALFEKYAEESQIIDGLQLYRYKEEDVCKFFAEVILNSAGRFNLNEFMQAWEESVPDGMHPMEEMLYGIAIIDKKSNPNVIWGFDERSLPEDITERLKILFAAKEKWSVPEISPYIQRLATEKNNVNALLAKYARASTVNGIKYYSSKHGK